MDDLRLIGMGFGLVHLGIGDDDHLIADHTKTGGGAVEFNDASTAFTGNGITFFFALQAGISTIFLSLSSLLVFPCRYLMQPPCLIKAEFSVDFAGNRLLSGNEG